MNEEELVGARMDALVFESRARPKLELVMAAAGFHQSGSGGFGLRPDGSVQHSVLYECTPAEYERRFPALRARVHGDLTCIDFIVSADAEGNLNAVLEGDPLPELLRLFGLTQEMETLAAARSRDLDAQFEAIGTAAARLFDTTKAPSAP
jgi:hypothetical protein